MEYLDPKFIVETLGLIGVISIIFAESGLFFGFFLPGDSLLFTAGLLASQGYLGFFPLIILCILASILGDSVGYAFGRKVGPRIFIKEESLFFSRKHIERSKTFFDKHGKKAIILARFMPIVRTFTPILAGVGQMEYPAFLRYNILGGTLWVLLLTCGGFFLGKVIPNADKYLLPIVILIIIVSILPGLIEVYKNKKINNKKL